MKRFDLHCDTLTEACKRGLSLRDNVELEVSLQRGNRQAGWAQCFAIWIPEELRGEAATRYFLQNVRYLQQQAQQYANEMALCRTTAEMDAAVQAEKCAAVLTVEGGAVLAGELANIDLLQKHGVRMLTLTWNGSCEIGDGAMVTAARGLTDFGRQAIPLLEQAGIAVDLSHASDPLFYDVASLTEKPFLATHSNARAVCPHPRNLTDAQFLELRRRGGVAGLNLHRWFLREDGEASMEDCFRHVYHFLSLGGEDAVALGSDFDGGELPRDIAGIQTLDKLRAYFSHMGLSDAILEKLFWQNARDFLQRLQTVEI